MLTIIVNGGQVQLKSSMALEKDWDFTVASVSDHILRVLFSLF